MSAVKGWCPSAHRPMMSGDGLLVRVNPKLGWLSADEALLIADLADAFGNGSIDLTSRANIQLRGVTEDKHAALLKALIKGGLVDADPMREARRTIVIGAGLIGDGPGEALAAEIEALLDELPDMPAKVGIAINLGPTLHDHVPGDFRFESSVQGVLLRADGAELGRPVTPETAFDALLDLMHWFLESGGAECGRMARHSENVALPGRFQAVPPKPTQGTGVPGPCVGGFVVGVPFGALVAADLRRLVTETGARRIGTTTWRLLRLDGPDMVDVPGFLTVADPLLKASACPGAPACVSASVQTRALAQRLAGRVKCTLHVSGCAKGCARQAVADVTLVGRDGRFDLVQNGRAGDTPERLGLTERDILELVG